MDHVTRRLLALIAVLALVLLAVGGSPAPAGAAPGPSAATEWWFDYWGVPALWAQGATGAGETIAVIDTGVQATIPELAGKVLPGADLTGQGGDGRTDYDSDAFGHGTAMASLMVAARGYAGIEGLAPDAKLLPISVPLQGSAGSTAVGDALPAAIRYAVDHGARIISMSLGGYRDPTIDAVPCPQTHQDAITYAISKGAIVVAAGGNGGTEGSPVEEPGVCLGVISVGSVTPSRTVSAFSSRHPYLSVAAPGEQIATLSRIAGTAYVGEGTSQATAITSAALALIWSKFPTLSNQQIMDKLLATTEDLGAAGRDDEYGLGLIRPDVAINSAVPVGSDDPVWDGIAPYLPAPSGTVAPSGPVAAGSPAATGSNPPGAVAIGASPPAIPPLAVVGVALALWGLLVLSVLTIFGVRSRGRRRRAMAARSSIPFTVLAPASGPYGPHELYTPQEPHEPHGDIARSSPSADEMAAPGDSLEIRPELPPGTPSTH
jgi:subtilisin family serine protease